MEILKPCYHPVISDQAHGRMNPASATVRDSFFGLWQFANATACVTDSSSLAVSSSLPFFSLRIHVDGIAEFWVVDTARVENGNPVE